MGPGEYPAKLALCHGRGGLMGYETLMWGLCGVVTFDDFRPVTLFEHKFLLGEDHVREPGVECPDLVEKI